MLCKSRLVPKLFLGFRNLIQRLKKIGKIRIIWLKIKSTLPSLANRKANDQIRANNQANQKKLIANLKMLLMTSMCIKTMRKTASLE